jgi:hypothetical protein
MTVLFLPVIVEFCCPSHCVSGIEVRSRVRGMNVLREEMRWLGDVAEWFYPTSGWLSLRPCVLAVVCHPVSMPFWPYHGQTHLCCYVYCAVKTVCADWRLYIWSSHSEPGSFDKPWYSLIGRAGRHHDIVRLMMTFIVKCCWESQIGYKSTLRH